MNKVDLSSFNNSWYKPGSFLKRFSWFLFSRVFINTYLPWPMIVKILILKGFGCNIGSNFVIKPRVNIKYPWFLELGDNVWVGEKVWIDNFVKVKISSNCCVSQEALLLTGNHNFKKSTFDLIPGEIILEEGSWIGARSIVCPGVKIGSHAVLGVGSVGNKNLDDYGIYRGNPALKIGIRVFD
jgi:putative colanic acid biosynthesis acetyltransferase WcaF